MMRAGSVPRCNWSNTSVWFWCVSKSAPAWQAATPLPGTTTACTSLRKSSVLPVQVDEEITTRPVLRSTAMTDQVANAELSHANNSPRIKRILRIKTLQIPEMIVLLPTGINRYGRRRKSEEPEIVHLDFVLRM